MQVWNKATRRVLALGKRLQDFRFPALTPRDRTHEDVLGSPQDYQQGVRTLEMERGSQQPESR